MTTGSILSSKISITLSNITCRRPAVTALQFKWPCRAAPYSGWLLGAAEGRAAGGHARGTGRRPAARGPRARTRRGRSSHCGVLGPDLRVLILLEYPGVSPRGLPDEGPMVKVGAGREACLRSESGYDTGSRPASREGQR